MCFVLTHAVDPGPNTNNGNLNNSFFFNSSELMILILGGNLEQNVHVCRKKVFPEEKIRCVTTLALIK